jgi:hypothetical protein
VKKFFLSSSAKADDPVTTDGVYFAARCLLDARLRGMTVFDVALFPSPSKGEGKLNATRVARG